MVYIRRSGKKIIGRIRRQGRIRFRVEVDVIDGRGD